MTFLDLVAVLLALSALFGRLNRRHPLLPHRIGPLDMGGLAALASLAVDAVVPGHRASGLTRDMLGRIDFSAVVMDGRLAFLPPPSSVPLLVWACVRCVIPIAPCLSIPDNPAKPALLATTCAVAKRMVKA